MGRIQLELLDFRTQKVTWVFCQSLLQPAGRGAHAGDAPPETSEDLQRIQTSKQRPRRQAQVVYRAQLDGTAAWCNSDRYNLQGLSGEPSAALTVLRHRIYRDWLLVTGSAGLCTLWSYCR